MDTVDAGRHKVDEFVLVDVFAGRPEAMAKAQAWLAAENLSLAEVAEEGMEEFFEKFIHSLGYETASNRKLIAARIRLKLGVAAPDVDEAPRPPRRP